MHIMSQHLLPAVPTSLGDWTDALPIKSALVVLLHVTRSGDTWAKTVAEKRAMLASGTGQMFAFWPGQWSASVRMCDKRDRRALLERL